MRRFGSTGPDDSKQPLIAQVIADWKTSLGGRVGSVDRIGVLEFPEGCRNSFAAFSAQLAVFSEKAVERSVSRSGGSSAHTATRSTPPSARRPKERGAGTRRARDARARYG